MTSRISLPAIAAFLALTSSVWAHPGHEHPVTPPENPAHWFIEPEHLLSWAGIACVVAVFYKARNIFASRSAAPAREKHPH